MKGTGKLINGRLAHRNSFQHGIENKNKRLPGQIEFLQHWHLSLADVLTMSIGAPFSSSCVLNEHCGAIGIPMNFLL